MLIHLVFTAAIKVAISEEVHTDSPGKIDVSSLSIRSVHYKGNCFFILYKNNQNLLTGALCKGSYTWAGCQEKTLETGMKYNK